MIFTDLTPPPDDLYLASTVQEPGSGDLFALHNSSPAFSFDYCFESPKTKQQQQQQQHVQHLRSSSLPRNGTDNGKWPSPLPLTTQEQQQEATFPTNNNNIKNNQSKKTTKSTPPPSPTKKLAFLASPKKKEWSSVRGGTVFAENALVETEPSANTTAHAADEAPSSPTSTCPSLAEKEDDQSSLVDAAAMGTTTTNFLDEPTPASPTTRKKVDDSSRSEPLPPHSSQGTPDTPTRPTQPRFPSAGEIDPTTTTTTTNTASRTRMRSLDATDGRALAPYKYVHDPARGIRHLNPAWAELQKTLGGESELFPFANRDTALPVVSYASQANLFASMTTIKTASMTSLPSSSLSIGGSTDAVGRGGAGAGAGALYTDDEFGEPDNDALLSAVQQTSSCLEDAAAQDPRAAAAAAVAVAEAAVPMESEMVESYEKAMQKYQQQCFWQALQDYEDIDDILDSAGGEKQNGNVDEDGSSNDMLETKTLASIETHALQGADKKQANNNREDTAAAVRESKTNIDGLAHQAALNHSDGMKSQLLEILARYEIPAGMLSKLLDLQRFDRAEILVDDSSGMVRPSDVEKKPPFAGFMTRWAEAQERILQLMELVAYLPSAPTYVVRFLNRPSQIVLKRHDGEQPTAFLNRVTGLLHNEFCKPPFGGSPALERIRESFHRHRNQSVIRYFMSHGVPDGGVEACESIVNVLMSRGHPERNPFTFLSCTDQDEDTVWMKECEEAAPYCSEFDDYMDESEEVLRDQGKAFPYSYGLYLVGQLVAAFNPNDLDAMDESVPFALQTLADLLGYRPLPSEYKYYFDSFVEAQKLLPDLEDYRREFVAKLPSLYDEFREVNVASDIVHVRNYRRRVKACNPTTSQAHQAISNASNHHHSSNRVAAERSSSGNLSPPTSPRRSLMRLLKQFSFKRQSSKQLVKKDVSSSEQR